MKNLHVSIAAVLLLVPLPGTATAQPKHPNLLFNRQELAEMKARIDKYPWARQTFERIKADAETRPDSGGRACAVQSGKRPQIALG